MPKIKVIAQISNEIIKKSNRFLPYEARAEICQNFGWLFKRFEDTEILF